MDSFSRSLCVLLTSLATFFMPDVGYSQTPPGALLACLSEANDAMRLKCYDREMQRAQAVAAPANDSQSAAATAASARPAVSGAQLSPEQAFGFQGSVARAEIDRRDAQQSTVDKLESKITLIEKRPLGELVVTLENGQVWVQKVPEATLVKLGDTVTIKRASLRSFLMSVPGGRTTRVARVQ